jgi:hypothetical protein
MLVLIVNDLHAQTANVERGFEWAACGGPGLIRPSHSQLASPAWNRTTLAVRSTNVPAWPVAMNAYGRYILLVEADGARMTTQELAPLARAPGGQFVINPALKDGAF